MSIIANTPLAAAIEDLAESVDIPPSKYKMAVERYTAVGGWLDAVDSPLKRYRPRVYPQGSFRLGTVIRPVFEGREADYDIDLVCCLDAGHSGFHPRDIKHLIGDRLKVHGTYRRMLDDEGRRCWTLKYAESDGVGFHLDALPAVPSSSPTIQVLVGLGVNPAFARHAIEITERRHEGEYLWVRGGSNPEGYAQWFDGVNASAAARVTLVQKRRLFEANRGIYASVRDVPDALVRSPLQRAVQVLKRHRDVRFSGHPLEKQKPISIIITTLAARAYSGEPDAASALAAILQRVEDFSTSGVIERQQDRWRIPNPVNPGENFADRWNEPGSRRAEAFFQWVAWALQDLACAEEQPSVDDAKAVLSEALGVRSSSARHAASGVPVPIRTDMVPALANSAHCQSPPWPVRTQYRVSISGSVRKEVHASRQLWRLTDRPISKNVAIRFEAGTNAPPPYEVKWQIVNTGTEAVAAGVAQLRGGFDNGTDRFGRVRWETARYRGTHWIEAFVIKDGVCVGRSGQTYVRIS